MAAPSRHRSLFCRTLGKIALLFGEECSISNTCRCGIPVAYLIFMVEPPEGLLSDSASSKSPWSLDLNFQVRGPFSTTWGRQPRDSAVLQLPRLQTLQAFC